MAPLPPLFILSQSLQHRPPYSPSLPCEVPQGSAYSPCLTPVDGLQAHCLPPSSLKLNCPPREVSASSKPILLLAPYSPSRCLNQKPGSRHSSPAPHIWLLLAPLGAASQPSTHSLPPAAASAWTLLPAWMVASAAQHLDLPSSVVPSHLASPLLPRQAPHCALVQLGFLNSAEEAL